MDFIEIQAKTKEEAITKACIDLGVSSDRLDYKVVSEGSSGFLGIGAKPAVILARKKEEPAEVEMSAAEEVLKESVREAISEDEKKAAEEPAEEKKEAVQEAPAAAAEASDAAEPAADAAAEKTEEEKPERSEEDIITMKASASKFLDSVFKAMELPVDITIDYDQEADALNIDFAGEDMGILIGKRGQTLDSLQYLTSLVVNRDQKHFVRIKLDTEDYRRRRKETLENLASNIARKVKKTRKPVSLEPMNPYERRIIHSSLQSNRFVETHSEGNEPYRYVVVTPARFERSERSGRYER
ncbi:MAG: protein jag [Eubacterium sp.]|nr:protein jag [Eubacterium sp.]